MTHAVTVPTPPFRTASGKLEVFQIPAAQDNLVWLVVAQDGEAAVVDGPDAGGALALCEERGFRLTTIWNTHTHHDHIGVNADLERRGLLDGMRVVGPKRAARDVPGITDLVDDGDTLSLGGVAGDVLLTEGHIDGHVSFVVDGVVFCGDTMFGAGCGYLFDGPPSKMHASLERLAALPGETRVCCAHEYTTDNLRFAFSVEPENDALRARIRDAWRIRGEGRSTIPSTIGLERETNPFLRHASEPLRTRVRELMPDRPHGTPAEVFAATRALKDRKDYKRLTDADLPIG